MKVIVIGGGPAGLVTLKFLATANEFYTQLTPIDVQLFEAEDDIGGTFKYRVWDKSEVRICPPLLALAECSHVVCPPSWSRQSSSPPSPTFASAGMLPTF